MSRFFKAQILPICKRSLLILPLLLLPNFSSAQVHNIDSMRLAYDYSENTHDRILTQIEIGRAYYNLYSFDSSVFEFRKAISLIPNDSLELKAKTMDMLAHAYNRTENIEAARSTNLATLSIYKDLGDREREARTYAKIGRTYYDYAEYDSAMTYYLQAKEIYESNNIVEEGYGYLLHYIGSVYKRQQDDSTACTYYYEEVEYGRKHGFKAIEAEGLYLTGICFEDPRGALSNYKQSLLLYQELGIQRNANLMYTLMSDVYRELDMLDSALYFQKLFVDGCRITGEISHMSSALSHMASLQIELGRYAEAEKNLTEALEIASETNVKQHIRYKDIYAAFFELKYAQSSYKDAVEYQSLYYAYTDSARDQEHQDMILEMQTLYDKEKSDSELAKQKEIAAKQKEQQEAELAYEANIKRFFLLGGLIVLGLAIFVFIKYRESQKQKQIITEQKREMQFQKELVEQQNQDILDSMEYASTIQKAIITSEDYFSKMFKEHFVFYKPRDIVSGDFYWAYENSSGKKLIAVGDCTGHGVPGAMMSMLGATFLNEIVVERHYYLPEEVLNRMRNQVKRALSDESRRDGMDMSFICIDGNRLMFAGANLPIYVLRKGELTEIKGNKQPIGHIPHEEQPFERQEFELQDNDQIYLFSDGYADQFGGPKGKKFKYKTFREKLAEISSKSLSAQCEIINNNFETWKGDLEQLDDVCVIGLKV